MSEWIDVNVSLPPPDENVWINTKEVGVIIGFHQNHYWFSEDADSINHLRITHWQPLIKPEPPTEEGIA